MADPGKRYSRWVSVRRQRRKPWWDRAVLVITDWFKDPLSGKRVRYRTRHRRGVASLRKLGEVHPSRYRKSVRGSKTSATARRHQGGR